MKNICTEKYGCRICTLYSGSGGNSTYISCGDTAILIDAGKSARALTNALREIGAIKDKGSPEKPPIDAIFITHEHSDHVGALAVFLKKNPIPVHVTEGSSERLYRIAQDTPMKDCIVSHPTIFSVTVGSLTVSSFPTSHDSRMSVGYRITASTPSGIRVFGYATDLGVVTPAVEKGLTGCEAVVLESNHDENMLLDGPYPYDLKLRIRSRRGHLSNRDAAAFASFLAENGTEHFLLAHLSKENNMPVLAYEETFSALADEHLTLRVADPDGVTFLLDETLKEPLTEPPNGAMDGSEAAAEANINCPNTHAKGAKAPC